jgi:hypothetical protein
MVPDIPFLDYSRQLPTIYGKKFGDKIIDFVLACYIFLSYWKKAMGEGGGKIFSLHREGTYDITLLLLRV